MSYNPIRMGGTGTYPRYVYTVAELSGGIGASKSASSNGRAAELDNMCFDGERLVTRGGIGRIGGELNGEFHSALQEEYCGSFVFHCGTGIYRFDGENISELKADVPDCKSFFLRMNSCVYLYTAQGKLFEVKSDFSCAQAEPYVPVIIKNADRLLSNFKVRESINMMTRRVKCSYVYDGLLVGTKYSVPYEVDETESISLLADGKTFSGCWLSRSGSREIIVNGTASNPKDVSEITLVYTIKDTEEKFEEYFSKIYGCTMGFTFGGTTKDGTRAFLTGNDGYPGMYFRSELKNPLYFPDTSQEVLGDGSECVNGAEKRYEKLYFFTERHIYAMSYAFSSENGAQFAISEINTGVGCDMRGSVKAADNTLVFANSLYGVYILQSTEIFDELNVRHISENLCSGTTLEFAAKNENAVFSSCSFDRKYHIFNGEKLYIWDYGRTPYYYGGGDIKKAGERPAWHIFSGFEGCLHMFSLCGKLYFVRGAKSQIQNQTDGDNENGQVPAVTEIMFYNPQSDSDIVFDADGNASELPVTGYFKTQNYDLNIMGYKRLISFSFEYERKSGDNPRVVLTFFGDGKEYYSFSPALFNCSGRAEIKLPPFAAVSFAVSFRVSEGSVGFSQLSFVSRKTDRIKYNM